MAKSKNGANTTHDASRPPRRSKAAEYEYESASAAESRIAQRRAQPSKIDDYQVRRQTILRHAAELFHARGLGDTTLADIARVAGLDRASVYYYFANKEEVFADVLRDAVNDRLATDTEIINRAIPPDEKLRLLICQLMQPYDKHYPYLYVYVREDIERMTLSPTVKAWLVDCWSVPAGELPVGPGREVDRRRRYDPWMRCSL